MNKTNRLYNTYKLTLYVDNVILSISIIFSSNKYIVLEYIDISRKNSRTFWKIASFAGKQSSAAATLVDVETSCEVDKGSLSVKIN